MAIWEWVLKVYARPGVAAETLELQDLHNQNTSYLLWAVHARTTDVDRLARAAAAARAWDQTALVPLRNVRRALKPALAPFPDGAREQLRTRVKDLELAAEKLLMETLESLAGETGDAPTLAVLRAASQAWGEAVPDAALAALATTLE